MYRTLSLVLAAAFLAAPVATLAADTAQATATSSASAGGDLVGGPDPSHPLTAVRPTKPDALTSCFDTYRFGSVPAPLQASLTKVTQGVPLSFSGTVTNENNYPVPNVQVWAKVFRQRSETKDPNGPDVVAWVPVSQKIDLKAGESKALTYTWNVPADAEPGQYQLATYVVASDRFEMNGLTFTDDVVGNVTNFEVVGQDIGGVRFAKESAVVNSHPYFFAAFPPVIPKGKKDVPVAISLANTTKESFTGTVTWELYSWDRVTNRTLLDTKDVKVSAGANATTSLTYTVTDTSHTVYYLVGTLKTSFGSQSIVGIRFVRNDVNLPRFNFVTGTPAADGSNGAAVACIHSMGHDVVKDGRVEVSAYKTGILSDLFGFLGVGRIAHATYAGPIVPDIYALSVPLSAAATNYTVKASLYQGGKLMDSVTIPYCQTGTCTSHSTRTVIIAVAVLIILIIIGSVFFIRKRRQRVQPVQPVQYQ